MHDLIHHCRWKPIVAASLLALICTAANADGQAPKPSSTHDSFLSMDTWQEPVAFAPKVQTASAQDTNAIPSPPGGDHILAPRPAPESTFPVPPASSGMLSPDGYCDPAGNIQLHDGGSPEDWSWGCGGSPYRNGPGFCDNWKVGCRWESSFEGMVLFREGTNIGGLIGATNTNIVGGLQSNPTIAQDFDHAVGGRVSFTGYTPRWTNYNVQAVYEGVEDWNASVVYPKFSPESDVNTGDTVTPPADSFEQRTLYYRSSLHSAEINIVRLCHPVWRPYMGVRYVRFDDHIRDEINQEAPFPLPAPTPGVAFETDRENLFELENQMIGFQIGLKRDIWRLGRMVSVSGYVNTGVYHNMVKRTNLMSTTTTQFRGDDSDTTANEASTSTSGVFNNEVTDLQEISYLTEGSVSGVCRLNRCCALVGGYQAIWIQNLHLADDAFLGTGVETRGMFIHGWHAGLEYRR